jgi:hypothetical protein
MLAIKQSSALPCPQHSNPPAHECASKPDGGEPFEKDLVTVRAPETSLLSPVGWRETSQTPLFLRKTNPKPLESVSSLLLSSSVRESQLDHLLRATRQTFHSVTITLTFGEIILSVTQQASTKLSTHYVPASVVAGTGMTVTY